MKCIDYLLKKTKETSTVICKCIGDPPLVHTLFPCALICFCRGASVGGSELAWFLISTSAGKLPDTETFIKLACSLDVLSGVKSRPCLC